MFVCTAMIEMTSLLTRSSLPFSLWRSFSLSSTTNPVTVFDRSIKKRQRDWSSRHPDISQVEYLREEIGWRVADKVADLTKRSEKVLEVGHGMISKHLESERVGHVTLLEGSEGMLERAERPEEQEIGFTRILGDEETMEEVKGQKFDLVLTSMVAHWINDLPGWMKTVHSLLNEDCPLIGAMLAEDTLFEMRCSLQLAEMERLGGISSHVSPFVRPPDIGSLLSSAGYQLVTLDSDEIQVSYPSMVHLMVDLQLMGESSASIRRPLHLRRDVAIAASAIYKSMYGRDDSCPATFRILSFIGWTQGPSTPKPAKRGSQTVSLKDLSQ